MRLTRPLAENNIEANTQNLKSFVRKLGIDLVGVADLSQLKGMPSGILPASAGFLEKFRFAVVLGAQLDKLGKQVSGCKVCLVVYPWMKKPANGG